MFPWQATVQNEKGDIVVSPVVTVYKDDGSSLADIFNAAGTALPNPLTGTTEGFVQFYVRDTGIYNIVGEKAGSLTPKWVEWLGDWSQPYPSRADMISADIPLWVNRVGYVSADGETVWFTRLQGSTAFTDFHGWVPDGSVYPNHFGENTTPGTTDMQDAIDAALLYVSTRGRGVKLRGETYYHSGTITYPYIRGIRIIGDQSSRVSADSFATRLVSDQTTGPQLRFTHDCADLVGVTVRAIGARASAEYSIDTPGIRIERGEDLSGVSIGGCTLQDVFVANQPGDGLQWSGEAFMHVIDRVAVRDCKGRSIHIDDGTITGRTNKGRAGGFRFLSFRQYENGGAIKIGTRGGGTYGVYRFYFEDFDAGAGSPTGLLNPEGCTVDVYGENVKFFNCGFGGRVGGTPENIGAAVSGRSIVFDTCRWVGNVGAIRLIDASPLGCDDVWVIAPFFTPDCVLSPAVEVSGSAGHCSVLAPQEAGSGKAVVSNWFPSWYTKGFVLASNNLNIYNRALRARDAVLSPTGPQAITATRDGVPVEYKLIRTGSGAVEGVMQLSGGRAQYGTSSDNDTALIRNNSVRMTVKANTINIDSLPTSASGLVSGDLWNDGGTLKVVA